MKFFIAIDRPIGSSLGKILETLIGSATCCEANVVFEADLVIIQDKQQLYEFYSEEQKFAVVSMEEVEALPGNVRWFHVSTVVAKLISYIFEINEEIINLATGKIDNEVVAGTVIKTGMEYAPEDEDRAQHILVVDDNQEHLKLALKFLGKKYFITLANGYDEARRLIEENNYDAVLSDNIYWILIM